MYVCVCVCVFEYMSVWIYLGIYVYISLGIRKYVYSHRYWQQICHTCSKNGKFWESHITILRETLMPEKPQRFLIFFNSLSYRLPILPEVFVKRLSHFPEKKKKRQKERIRYDCVWKVKQEWLKKNGCLSSGPGVPNLSVSKIAFMLNSSAVGNIYPWRQFHIWIS